MSVLLNTNVVSEPLRPSSDPAVEIRVGDRRATGLYFSAIGEAELRCGVAILPAGRRQTAPASAIKAILRKGFADRVLPFDSDAAGEYADVAAAGRSAGRIVPPADCRIAALARSRGMAVATRDIRDFEDIEVVDPWTAA